MSEIVTDLQHISGNLLSIMFVLIAIELVILFKDMGGKK